MAQNLQLSVTQEIVGSFSEMKEEPASVFAQAVVEFRYNIYVQEFVKESTASFPSISLIIQNEIPRVHIHA